MPKKFAHACKLFGRASTKYIDSMITTKPCITQVATTASAVRKEGCEGFEVVSASGGVALGKKMRKRSKLARSVGC